MRLAFAPSTSTHFTAHPKRILVIDRKTAIELLIIVVVATLHGYAAAWLAVRILFRPRYPVKVLGIPIWPQGMIPRHRQRLAETIGRAVGTELVSQETVVSALFDTTSFAGRWKLSSLHTQTECSVRLTHR